MRKRGPWLISRRADSANCCSGSHNTAETCPPDGVQYYDYFKNACKNSYVYAYDESSKTALWTCPTADKAGEYLLSLSYRDALLTFLAQTTPSPSALKHSLRSSLPCIVMNIP